MAHFPHFQLKPISTRDVFIKAACTYLPTYVYNHQGNCGRNACMATERLSILPLLFSLFYLPACLPASLIGLCKHFAFVFFLPLTRSTTISSMQQTKPNQTKPTTNNQPSLDLSAEKKRILPTHRERMKEVSRTYVSVSQSVSQSSRT